MRESLNGMASAFEGLSRFARERESVRRPAEGTPLGVSADTRFSLHLLLKLKKRESRLMVWRQLPKLIPAGSIPVSRSKKRTGTSSVLFAYAEGTPLGVSADTRLSRARIRAHLAPFLNLTKPKQRGLDRKRVSRHICIVKALGNMSLYYLRALPCICGNLPACDCFAP